MTTSQINTSDAQSINWMQSALLSDWANLRTSTGIQVVMTDPTFGIARYNFPRPFNIITLGISIVLDLSGGFRNWIYGVKDQDRFGFDAQFLAGNVALPITSTLVGIYYLAVGR